jgi:N-acetylglucosamine-6-sulfatase
MRVRQRSRGFPLSAALLVAVASLAVSLPGSAGTLQATPPNIVLILSDDQDGSAMTISKMPYLYSRTPEGGGGWYRFDNAFINNATCCPSRATILRGQWSHHTGVEFTGGAPKFDDADTIATRLHDAGYRTGYIGKYHLGSNGPVSPGYVPPGWDYFVDHREHPHPQGECGSGVYYDYNLNENGTLTCHDSAPEDYETDVLRAKARGFIDRAQTHPRPFFLVFAPRAPHGPWTAANRHIGTYANEPVPFPPDWNEDTSDKPAWWAARPELKASNRTGPMRKEWDTLLALDEVVAMVQSRLQAIGLMSNSVILYMTDNGFSFGEHRWGDKRCVYDSCTRTPLYVKYGTHSEGTVFDSVVGNEDLAATFADLAGTTAPADGDGQSFANMLRNRTAPADWQNEALLRSANPHGDPGSPPDAYAIRTPDHLYAETNDPAVGTTEYELYDLAADPYQLENVAGRPEYGGVQAELANRLAELRR